MSQVPAPQFHHKLSDDEAAELQARWRRGDDSAGTALYYAAIRACRSRCAKYQSFARKFVGGDGFDDLNSTIDLGICRAMGRWKPSGGRAWATFAVQFSQWTVLRWIAKNGYGTEHSGHRCHANEYNLRINRTSIDTLAVQYLSEGGSRLPDGEILERAWADGGFYEASPQEILEGVQAVDQALSRSSEMIEFVTSQKTTWTGAATKHWPTIRRRWVAENGPDEVPVLRFVYDAVYLGQLESSITTNGTG